MSHDFDIPYGLDDLKLVKVRSGGDWLAAGKSSMIQI